MYLLILLLPLLPLTVAAFSGRYIGRNGSTITTTSCISSTAIPSTFASHEVAIAEPTRYIEITTRIDRAMLHASRGFPSDTSTVLMLIVVTYVSAPVHSYPIEYMAHDPHIQRFMSHSSIPKLPTLILVTADNSVQTSIG